MKKSKITTAKQVDLHLHSYYSDGENSPHEVLRRAKKAGFELVAISDHNTLEHIDETLYFARKIGLKTLPTAEIGGTFAEHKLHLLAYGFNPANTALKTLFKRLQAKRKKEITLIVKKLLVQKFKIDIEAIMSVRADYPGLVHVIDALLKHRENRKRILKEVGGLDIFSIINFYFARGSGAFVEEKFPSTARVIKTVKRAGGIVVLAHPGFHLSFREDKVIKSLVAEGLSGLEVFTPKHNWQQTLHYELLAKKLGLVMTAGSDYHARIHKSDIPLATPVGYQKSPPEIYDHFVSLLKRKAFFSIKNT